MRYENVSVATVVHVDAPVRVNSADLVGRLTSTLERLQIRPGLLEEVAGIHERRVWGRPTQVADAAALAGERALTVSGVTRDRIGLLISTSVSRDYIEPSIASVVHGSLGLPETCQNFDVGNACLAFINGMDVGPAAVPLTLSKLDEAGRLARGARVGLLGIGSGLNCSMAEILW